MTATTAPPPKSLLLGSPARRRRERMVAAVFLAAGLLSIVISVFIVLTLFGRAIDFIFAIDPGQLMTQGWFPRRDLYDLLTVFIGTLVVSGIAMLLAAPI